MHSLLKKVVLLSILVVLPFVGSAQMKSIDSDEFLKSYRTALFELIELSKYSGDKSKLAQYEKAKDKVQIMGQRALLILEKMREKDEKVFLKKLADIYESARVHAIKSGSEKGVLPYLENWNWRNIMNEYTIKAGKLSVLYSEAKKSGYKDSPEITLMLMELDKLASQLSKINERLSGKEKIAMERMFEKAQKTILDAQPVITYIATDSTNENSDLSSTSILEVYTKKADRFFVIIKQIISGDDSNQDEFFQIVKDIYSIQKKIRSLEKTMSKSDYKVLLNKLNELDRYYSERRKNEFSDSEKKKIQEFFENNISKFKN